jgi:hypothetical protein
MATKTGRVTEFSIAVRIKINGTASLPFVVTTFITIQFHNSSILTTKTRYMDRIVREAIEIELRPYNINRENDFSQ